MQERLEMCKKLLQEMKLNEGNWSPAAGWVCRLSSPTRENGSMLGGPIGVPNGAFIDSSMVFTVWV